MKLIDTIRFVWLPCALFVLSTEIVCATSGWDNVKRNVGNDCCVSIRNSHCFVSTKQNRVRIRVWYHPSRPEYDYNSKMLFFRFHSIVLDEDTEPEYHPDRLAEKVDFDYMIVNGDSHVSSDEWTYFIVDKFSEEVFGPFTEEEFLNHPEAADVTGWNWKSPEKTRSERNRDGLAFTVLIIFLIILVNIWWLGPLFVLTVFVVVIVGRRLKKRKKHEMKESP